MKRLILVLVLALFLTGCYTHINKVQDKWGPPAEVKDRGDTIHYFYYFHHGRIKGSIVDADKITGTGITTGWLVVEIVTDRNGKILKKRKYWKQPDLGEDSK